MGAGRVVAVVAVSGVRTVVMAIKLIGRDAWLEGKNGRQVEGGVAVHLKEQIGTKWGLAGCRRESHSLFWLRFKPC